MGLKCWVILGMRKEFKIIWIFVVGFVEDFFNFYVKLVKSIRDVIMIMGK